MPIETLCLRNRMLESAEYVNPFVTINSRYTKECYDSEDDLFKMVTITKVFKKTTKIAELSRNDHEIFYLFRELNPRATAKRRLEPDLDLLLEKRKKAASIFSELVHKYLAKQRRNDAARNTKRLAKEHAPVYVLDKGAIKLPLEVKAFLSELDKPGSSLIA